MKRTCCCASAPDGRLVDRPAPGPAFTSIVELRDFLRVHLYKLTYKQRSAVLAWSEGTRVQEIAAEEGVSEEAVRERLNVGLRRLRQLAGNDDAP